MKKTSKNTGFLTKIMLFAEDILIFSGCFIITGTTFYLSPIIGCYLLGAQLFGLGLLLAMAGRRKGGD
ncbi:MAG: hypothetical protein K6U74_01050 [Firmicutes bacterium]|nr:hypothetical protein [Bacillota bacterium]